MTRCVITGQPVGFHPTSKFTWTSEWEKRLQLLDTMDKFELDPVKSTNCSCDHLCRPKEYLVLSPEKQISYTMFEESSACCRNCCRFDRPFVMHVRDQTEQDVLLIKHNFQCCAHCCCFGSCCNFGELVTVSAPNGEEFGVVSEQPGCGIYTLNVYETTARDYKSFQITTTSGVSCNNHACGQDVEFKILNPDGRQIGSINFWWIGPLMSWLFSAPYTVSLTEKVTLRQKALFMGAALLLEYAFFDTQRDGRYAACGPPYEPTA